MTVTEIPSSHHSFLCSLNLFTLLLSFASLKQCFLPIINTRLINSSLFSEVFTDWQGFLQETLSLSENRRAKFPSAQRRNIKPCREKKKNTLQISPKNCKSFLRMWPKYKLQHPLGFYCSLQTLRKCERSKLLLDPDTQILSEELQDPGSDPGAPLTVWMCCKSWKAHSRKAPSFQAEVETSGGCGSVKRLSFSQFP